MTGSLLRQVHIFIVFLAFNTTAIAQTIYDDFNDNSINTSLWTASISGSGVQVTEADQRVEIDLASSAGNGPNGIFGGGYSSNAIFEGDLDVSIKFRLLNWPLSNGVRIGLGFTPATNSSQFWTVERVSLGRGESVGDVYLTDFNHNLGRFDAAGNSLEGQLRLMRTGTTVSAFYLDAGNWQSLRTDTITDAPIKFGFSAWSHDQYFDDKAVKVAFDDVHVVPLPPSILLFGFSILSMLIMRKKAA